MGVGTLRRYHKGRDQFLPNLDDRVGEDPRSPEQRPGISDLLPDMRPRKFETADPKDLPEHAAVLVDDKQPRAGSHAEAEKLEKEATIEAANQGVGSEIEVLKKENPDFQQTNPGGAPEGTSPANPPAPAPEKPDPANNATTDALGQPTNDPNADARVLERAAVAPETVPAGTKAEVKKGTAPGDTKLGPVKGAKGTGKKEK